MTSQPPVRFAAVGLDHAHIFGQISGLLDARCDLVGLATDDPDAAVARQVRERYPDVPVFDDPEALIAHEGIDVITTAAVPDRRGPIAVAGMRATART